MAVGKQVTFDQWIASNFDHPICLDIQSAEVIAYFTRTFEECDTVLSSFSDEQLSQGLCHMIGLDCEYARALLDTDVPLLDRLHCIGAMVTLFERCFARRCSPHLSHLINAVPKLDISWEGVSPLNAMCFDWWAILPLHGVAYHGPDHQAYYLEGEQLDRAIIAVLQRILEIDSIACQESALFGLAEGFSMYYPEVYEMIDDFIDHHLDLWEQFNPRVQECLFGSCALEPEHQQEMKE